MARDEALSQIDLVLQTTTPPPCAARGIEKFANPATTGTAPWQHRRKLLVLEARMAIEADALLKYLSDELDISTSGVGADSPRLGSLV